ncbi:MAG: hypothetical protein HY731_04000 [Candidatus Tectomicrobia bacterium]|nr:hypothetical protein [Candidatus Tectomicrobia bacterium]
MPNLERLRRIAEIEFLTLIQSTAILRDKLRVILIDGSYIDFWWSTQIPGRYAFHWERRHIDGTMYRHDNMPHPQWKRVASFPKHFHVEDPQTVVESYLADDPEEALREFLTFAENKIHM